MISEQSGKEMNLQPQRIKKYPSYGSIKENHRRDYFMKREMKIDA